MHYDQKQGIKCPFSEQHQNPVARIFFSRNQMAIVRKLSKIQEI